jgi:hypothetical protein
METRSFETALRMRGEKQSESIIKNPKRIKKKRKNEIKRRDKNRETGAGCTIRKLMTPENHLSIFSSNFFIVAISHHHLWCAQRRCDAEEETAD